MAENPLARIKALWKETENMVRVADVQGEGRGLHATCTLPPGTRFEYIGEPLRRAGYDSRYPNARKPPAYCMAHGFTDDKDDPDGIIHIDCDPQRHDGLYTSPAAYCNHRPLTECNAKLVCCDANSLWPIVVTTKTIHTGEQICFPYNTSYFMTKGGQKLYSYRGFTEDGKPYVAPRKRTTSNGSQSTARLTRPKPSVRMTPNAAAPDSTITCPPIDQVMKSFAHLANRHVQKEIDRVQTEGLVEIRYDQVKGSGLFALQQIKPGAVFKMYGRIIDRRDYEGMLHNKDHRTAPSNHALEFLDDN